MLVGTDGGIHLTHDRGAHLGLRQHGPLAQFYEVHFDMRQPYWVCGGLQDNGSWCGPSRTFFQQGIGNEDWFRVGGGDGFYTVVDPVRPQRRVRREPGRERAAARPAHERAPR